MSFPNMDATSMLSTLSMCSAVDQNRPIKVLTLSGDQFMSPKVKSEAVNPDIVVGSNEYQINSPTFSQFD